MESIGLTQSLPMEEAIRKEVSIRISKELERKGYCKHKLEVTSSLVKIRESLENGESSAQTLIQTGSNAEGTDVTGSDRDTMIVLPNCIIVADNDKVRDNQAESNVFLMVQDNARPCYTKLQLLRESQNRSRNDLFHTLGGKDELCTVDENDKYWFSSEKFTEHVTNHVSGLNQSSTDHVVSSFRVHGPCATFDNSVRKTKFDTDFAYCFPCSVLPKEVHHFIKRNRHYQWPPQDLVRKVFSRGFHVVAVGDKSSSTHSVEWRMSFALLERELTWSLNDTQCKCYVMLKILQKMFIEELAPDELSSYALKTTIFWCAETHDPSFWKEENLLQCIYHCLSKLCSYVTDRNLPHFVVPENNLLVSKFEDKEKRVKVAKQLKEMSEWDWSSFLQCPQLSALKIQFDDLGHDVKLFLRCSRHPNISIPFYQDILSFRACQSLYMDININLSTTDDIHNMLSSLKSSKVDGIGKEILKFGINAFLFKATKMKNKAPAYDETNCANNENTNEQIKLLNDQEETILYERVPEQNVKTNILPSKPELGERFCSNEGLDGSQDGYERLATLSPDMCTGNLQTALEYLLSSKFERAEEMIKKVLNSYEPHVVYLGMCGPEEADMIEYACFTASSGELSLFEKVQKLLAFDFVISKRDHVTQFLHQEQLFWSEEDVPLCIHPRILMYYFYFLSAFGQGQETKALGCLFALSMNVNGMYKNRNLYSHIAWNILGHCRFLLRQNSRAMRAYSNSLLCKPSNNPAISYIGQC